MAKKKIVPDNIEIKIRELSEEENNIIAILKEQFHEKTSSKVFKKLLHEFVSVSGSNRDNRQKFEQAQKKLFDLEERQESFLNGFRTAKILIGDKNQPEHKSFSVNGVVQKCPFKQPVMVPTGIQNQARIVEMDCSSKCPLMLVEESEILINCGSEIAMFEIENENKIPNLPFGK